MSIQIKLIRRKINVSSIHNSCVHEFKMKSSNLNLRYFFFCFAFQRPYRSKVSNHFSITGNKQINWIKAHWVGGRDEKERDGYEERERERYRRVTSEVCAAGDTIEVATGD